MSQIILETSADEREIITALLKQSGPVMPLLQIGSILERWGNIYKQDGSTELAEAYHRLGWMVKLLSCSIGPATRKGHGTPWEMNPADMEEIFQSLKTLANQP